MASRVPLQLVLGMIAALAACHSQPVHGQGLTLQRFANTALAGKPSGTSVATSLADILVCPPAGCTAPASALVTGRVTPPAPGNYGFNITASLGLPYPSNTSYARLWVNDHLLYPSTPGGGAPLWIPLPPRTLDSAGTTADVPSVGLPAASSAPTSSYEVRLEYVCLAASGCGKQTLALRWSTYAVAPAPCPVPPPSPAPSPHPPPPTGRVCWPHGAFAPIPSSMLLPTQSAPEVQRRALASRLQNGWGTYWNPSVLTWVLLPESFAVQVGLYQLSTGQFLDPATATINPMIFHEYVITAGLHSYNSSYIETSVTWRNPRPAINVTIATTVDYQDSGALTLVATVNDVADTVTNATNASDFALVVVPTFVHGRAGSVNATATSVCGAAAGMRSSTLSVVKGRRVVPTQREYIGPLAGALGAKRPLQVVNGTTMAAAGTTCDALPGCNGFTFRTPTPGVPPAPEASLDVTFVGFKPGSSPLLLPHLVPEWFSFVRANSSAVPCLPETFLAVSLKDTVVMATTPPADAHGNVGPGGGTLAAPADVIMAKTKRYRADEAATLTKYNNWGEVKDAMQSSLMWSVIYDPKEGLIAPVTRNWNFAPSTVDGDENYVLFCWDGSFASYMLSLDALDLAVSNLVQIVKMRTTAGFVPSNSAGTRKTRDRSNPPVTAKILHEMTKRWGVGRTKWVVELLFDDLYNWNTWMWARRREAPHGLLSWGSDPFPYTVDGGGHSDGGGGASLESGLDNGPVMEGVPFNQTGLYVQDEYDAGYTGLYLMDCAAQIELATMLGRDDAVQVLQSRREFVSKGMQRVLWNESAGYFQNKLSAGLVPIERMAPTHFYPLLAGPHVGPSEAQAAATITKHMTNPKRFAVWPSGVPPATLPPPEARPFVQWVSEAKGDNNSHTLCCRLECNFQLRGGHRLVRYEGMGLASVPLPPHAGPRLQPIYQYACGPNGTGFALGLKGWSPTAAEGGPCAVAPKPTNLASAFAAPAAGPQGQHAEGRARVEAPAPVAYAYASRGGDAAADLVELEVWHRAAGPLGPSDHYVVGSDGGKKDAQCSGYTKVASLGFIWPPPGSAKAVSRYGLPSISKDDPAYTDQNYWHGRAWSPMMQIVYWGLDQYNSTVATGALQGLVAQSKALLLKEWRGYSNPAMGSFAGSGRYVYENFDADTAEGYGYSSEAQPMYSWGALAGFIGLQANGFYDPLP